MSVLDTERIRELLRLPITDPHSLRVTPLLSPDDQVKDDAVDIRLGSCFLVPRSEKRSTFVPGKTPGQDVAHRLHLPPGRELILPGKGVVLASTFEYIKMPVNVSAQVLTRSSIGRIFVTTATATLVHPLYRGCLTLEIVNLGNASVELRVLSRIAQLQFSETGIRSIATDEGTQPMAPDDKVTGRYAAAVEPEFSDFAGESSEYARLLAFLPGTRDQDL